MVLGNVGSLGLDGTWRTVVRGMAVLKDLPDSHLTFSDARPLTALLDAEAVAPTGTCTQKDRLDIIWCHICLLLCVVHSHVTCGLTTIGIKGIAKRTITECT